MFIFDRKKNIIRSGENIAVADIDACLQTHFADRVAAIAV